MGVNNFSTVAFNSFLSFVFFDIVTLLCVERFFLSHVYLWCKMSPFTSLFWDIVFALMSLSTYFIIVDSLLLGLVWVCLALFDYLNLSCCSFCFLIVLDLLVFLYVFKIIVDDFI